MKNTNHKILEAWDEVGLLTSTAADTIPFLSGASASKPEDFDPTLRRFKHTGSAFTIVNRIAHGSPDGVQSIFCGTTLGLHRAQADISKDLLPRVELIAERHPQILRPWSRHEVLANLDEDLALDRSKVGADMLDVVSYFLQGRPRITTVFKGLLYRLKEQLTTAATEPSHEELLLLALAQTKEEAIAQFSKNLDRYVTGGEHEDADRAELRHEQLEQMKQLYIKGYLTNIKWREHDLVNGGILYMEETHSDSARSRPLEPLMMIALAAYFEVKKVEITDLITQWLCSIQKDLATNWQNVPAHAAKGFAAEVLLADVLATTGSTLDGRPLTSHPLFSVWRGTFLDDYTLRAKRFERDLGRRWLSVLKEQDDDVIVLPPDSMRPDLFGLLRCIPGSSSHAAHGDHCIPLTAGVKTRVRIDEATYRDNYHSTDLWAAFTKDDKVIANAKKDRATAQRVLVEAFPTTDRRAVRISFVYNANYGSYGVPELSHPDLPSISSLSQVGVQGQQIHAQFDFRTPAFEQVLRQHSDIAAQCMKAFVVILSSLSSLVTIDGHPHTLAYCVTRRHPNRPGRLAEQSRATFTRLLS